MSLGSHCSDPKRIKLDLNEVLDPITLPTPNNSNLDDLLNSPSDTCENTSIISAFDHDSSSILSGSFYESSGEVLLSEVITKGILKSPDSSFYRNSQKNRKRIKFHEIEIFYFNRQQSFCSVPSLGGSALGMEMQHFLSEKHSFDSDLEECMSRKKYDSTGYDKTSKCLKEEYSILQPIVAKHRRILLKNSGTSRIETVDKEVCDLIRSSRERCGCQCVVGQCVPETCACAQNGIQCQVDRGNFPCCCGPNPCANPLGRVEFNPIRVRTHFIHTIMRLQMQDQYQSDDEETKQLSKCQDLRSSGVSSGDPPIAKEFDLNMCNSTDQGSCRDCQNDKYLHVLMNEWTHQLQKLHTSKHYPTNPSIPYNAWTYFPDSFCSTTTFCDKDSSPFPILPYCHYTVSALPAMNFGVNQINYHGNVTDVQYQLSTSTYSNSCIDGNFSNKSSIAHFSESNEDLKLKSYTKQHVQETSTSKSNSDCESQKICNQLTSSYTYPNIHFPEEKSAPIYNRYPYEKSSTFLCKYSSPISGIIQSDLKEIGYTASAYVNTVPFPENKVSTLQPVEPPLIQPSSSSGPCNDKITHAANGQLYTVLQPVSESGIVSTFYQNSQSSESCKMCKYKSSSSTTAATAVDNRQRNDHICVADYSLASAISNQLPIECADSSEVCA